MSNQTGAAGDLETSAVPSSPFFISPLEKPLLMRLYVVDIIMEDPKLKSIEGFDKNYVMKQSLYIIWLLRGISH